MKDTMVDRTHCDKVREYLKELIQALDALDEQDYFGTEGWRHDLMGE